MATFSRSWDFQAFAADVRLRQRFFRSTESEYFFEAIASTVPRRASIMPKGTELWRAQRGCNEGFDEKGASTLSPFDRQRMKPLTNKAHEGRVNPKGIPCLYVATRPDTAIAEVRAGIGEYVTIANVRVARDLRILDCTSLGDERAAGQSPLEAAVWSAINQAFSTPTSRLEDVAEYAPTQVLGELFRSLSFDGITYRTAFGTEGMNVALFGLRDAEIMGLWVYRIDDVKVAVSAVAGSARPELGISPVQDEWRPVTSIFDR